MILGGLIDRGSGLGDVGALTSDQAVHWWNCLMLYRKEVAAKKDT